jgi:rhodanese-related sulfurtransferase
MRIEGEGQAVRFPMFGQNKKDDDPGEPFTWISVEDAKKMLDDGQTPLIDVREPWEYRSGHIVGARSAPLQSLLRQPGQYLSGESVMFVCAVGERSAVACEMAAAFGIKQVYNIRGGTNSWISKGYPVEK